MGIKVSYEYVVITGHREYEDRVNNLLGEGWVLQGGVSMSRVGEEAYYAQAMTKETAVYEVEA